jgi:hypothetical protein
MVQYFLCLAFFLADSGTTLAECMTCCSCLISASIVIGGLLLACSVHVGKTILITSFLTQLLFFITMIAIECINKKSNATSEQEYDEKDVESETTSKTKLIKQILWYIEQIGNQIDHPFVKSSRESLQILTITNLEKIDEQLSTIYKMTQTGNEGIC